MAGARRPTSGRALANAVRSLRASVPDKGGAEKRRLGHDARSCTRAPTAPVCLPARARTRAVLGPAPRTLTPRGSEDGEKACRLCLRCACSTGTCAAGWGRNVEPGREHAALGGNWNILQDVISGKASGNTDLKADSGQECAFAVQMHPGHLFARKLIVAFPVASSDPPRKGGPGVVRKQAFRAPTSMHATCFAKAAEPHSENCQAPVFTSRFCSPPD